MMEEEGRPFTLPNCAHSNFSDSNLTETETWCVGSFYVLPLVCVCGLGLNLGCLLIFCRLLGRSGEKSRQMLHFLMALCSFDALQLLLSPLLTIPSALITYRNGIEGREASPATYSIMGASMLSVYPLLMAANYSSIWTITAISVQRYTAVCHPLASRKYSILRKAQRFLLLIVVLAVAINIPRYWEYERSDSNGTAELFTLQLGKHQLPNHVAYVAIMDGVIYSLSMYVIPALLIGFMHCRIGAAMKRSGNLRRERGGEGRSQGMIVAIVLLFFVCQTLAFYNRWRSLLTRLPVNGSQWLGQEKKDAVAGVTNVLANILVNLNSTLNPFIYFLFSRNFKDFLISKSSLSANGRTKSVDEASRLLKGKKATGTFRSSRQAKSMDTDRILISPT